MSSFDTQLQFSRALTVVRCMPIECPWQPSAHSKLQLYGLFKQATQGDCNQSRPSSRLIVEHAKWKAWDDLRHVSPIEAQKEYVRVLSNILEDFMSRLPLHDMTPKLHRCLQYVQTNSGSISEDMLANVSADTNQRWLQQIDAEEIHLDNNGHGLHTPLKPQPSSNSTTASTYTYPVTPDLSPNQIQQLQQRKQQWYERNRSHALLNQSRSFPAQLDGSHYDGFSDADTIDREVAATTSGLGLPAPDQHPYYGIVDRSASYQNSSLHPQATLDHVPEATHPTGHKSQRRKSVVTPHSHQSITEQAFEALQTQVAALTEQLDHMKQRLAEKEQIKRQMRWSWLWMAKTVGKHALINLVILVLLFLVLLKRRSPIAYALLGYATPRIKSLLTSLQHRLTSRHVSV